MPEQSSPNQAANGIEQPGGGSPPADFSLVERDGAVYRPDGGLVCNFVVLGVRDGNVSYVGGKPRPLHEVDIELADGSRKTWRVAGDIYAPANWTDMVNDNATIASPASFRWYLHHILDRRGVRSADADLRMVHTVGTYRDETGALRPSDGVVFPYPDECVYNSVSFPRAGDKGVFEGLARLSTDDVIRAVLTYILGALLKPAWGFYPHLVLTGDRESGKTTQMAHVCRLLGLRKLAGPTEFRTRYRQEKSLANTNIPVCVDEIGRVEKMGGLVDTLNLAYNVQHSTRGTGGKTLVLQAPLVMLGQDFPVRDEALLSKVLHYPVVASAKDAGALRQVAELTAPFPLGDFLDRVSALAAKWGADTLLRVGIRGLRGELKEELEHCWEAMDRTLANYATQLAAGMVVNEYGLRAPPAGFYIEAARQQLKTLRESGLNVGVRFLTDAKLFVPSGTSSGTGIDQTSDGVYVNVPRALRCLGRKGRTYDVSDPRTITRLLCDKGLAEKARHRFDGHQLRAVLIPTDTWEALG